MVLNNQQYENFFETPEIANDLAQKYYIILADLEKMKAPPLPVMFRQEFEKRWKITMSEEEFTELREYATDTYLNEIPDQIGADYETGKIQTIKYK